MVKRQFRSFYYRTNHLKNSWFDRRNKLVILLYHRVLLKTGFNPLNTIISKDIFLSQIDTIARQFPILSLTDVLNEKYKKNKISIVITFDDGYIDNYEIVFPELKKRGIPATFFVLPNYVSQKKALWDWEILSYLNEHPNVEVIDIGDQRVIKRPQESALAFGYRLFNILRQLDHECRMNILEKLRCESSFENSFMSWEHILEMSKWGMEIGSHSLTHSSLAQVSPQEARQEIFESKKIIELKLEKPCLFFSLPFGSLLDFSPSVLKMVKEAAYRVCLSNIQGYNPFPLEDDRYLKRVAMDSNRSIGSILA